MNKFLYKDKKNRILFYKIENNKFIKKNIINNMKIKNTFRLKSSFDSYELNIYRNSKEKLNKRCLITGRNSKIATNLHFSRIQFLRFARSGSIYGIRKSC